MAIYFRNLILGCFFAVICQLQVQAAAVPANVNAQPKNTMLGWQVAAENADVKITKPDKWQRLFRTFNTEGYSRLRVYLRLHGNGKVWFDDVTVSPFVVHHGSFERHSKGKVIGWHYDRGMAATEVLLDTTKAKSGKSSLKLKNKCDVKNVPYQEFPFVRVWQDFACKPNTNMNLNVWARYPDGRNDKSFFAYAEVYGLKKNGQLGKYWLTSPPVKNYKVSPEPILLLNCEPDSKVVLRRNEKLMPGELKRVMVDMDMQAAPQGCVRVKILDGKTNEVLTEVLPGSFNDGLGDVAPAFVVPASGEVTLEITAATKSQQEIIVRGAKFVEFAPSFPVQEYSSRGKTRMINSLPVIKGKVAVTPGMQKVMAMLRRKLADVADSADATKSLAIKLKYDKSLKKEAYRLDINNSEVIIKAADGEGFKWGVMTFTQLMFNNRGQWLLPVCEIFDYPVMPLRLCYNFKLPDKQSDIKKFCERLLRSRMTHLVIEDPLYFRMDDLNIARYITNNFALIRSYGIEPVPLMQSFGYAGTQIKIDPRVSEGLWVKKEQVQLFEEKPAALAQRRVIRTDATDIEVRSYNGKTKYFLGKDYAVIDGSIKNSSKPFMIKRIASGRIRDAAKLRVSYDYIPANVQCYCPFEPLSYKICFKALDNVIKKLKPTVLHIGHDEPASLGKDSRCRKKRRSHVALVAQSMRAWYKQAKLLSPDIKVMAWADAINPYHGLQHKANPKDYKLIPQDLILNVWFYGPNDPQNVGRKSIDFFSDMDFPTTASPWFDRQCAANWGSVGLQAMSEGKPFLGLFYTSWKKLYGALEATGKAAWNPKQLAD